MAASIAFLPGWESPPVFASSQGHVKVPAVRRTAIRMPSPRLSRGVRPRTLKVVPGAKYGKWTVIEEVAPQIGDGHSPQRLIRCECECQKRRVVRLANLEAGTSTSCGNACRLLLHRHDARIAEMHGAGQTIIGIARELDLDKKTVSRALKRGAPKIPAPLR